MVVAIDEDEYLVPLQDQRVFGAGIKRKRVNFVSAEDPSAQSPPRPTSTVPPGDLYLNLVLRNETEITKTSHDETEEFTVHKTAVSPSSQPLCEICNLPIDSEETTVVPTRPHEASIAHQVCLSHSHPPSHLDRDRHGLKYLSSYGWDPDSRLGLGTTGSGIRIPIKGKPKNDTVGLGVKPVVREGKTIVATTRKIPSLDAKQARKQEEVDRRKRERLQEIFYRNDDVETYLGGSS